MLLDALGALLDGTAPHDPVVRIALRERLELGVLGGEIG
jgi:hypothetical protein